MTERIPHTWNTSTGQAHRPITRARRQLFLEILAETGNFRAAARAATPHSHNAKRPGYSSFYHLQNRDADFAAAVADALEEAKANVEQEIFRRGQEGYLEPVYQKGERVFEPGPDGKMMPASVRRYSDVLLLRRAAALMPDKYSERKQIEHSGVVAHAQMQISPQDIAHLSPAQRDSLADILKTLADARGERDDESQEPRMIDVTPTNPQIPSVTPEPTPPNAVNDSSRNRRGGEQSEPRLIPRKVRESPKESALEAWELMG
jgi:hypothetical protein